MRSRVISAFAAEEEKRVLSLKPVLAPHHGRYGDHPHQVYDAWPAEDPDAPLVILLHGGYWRYDRMHLTPFAAYLAGQGLSTVLPGFRRSGGAGGVPRDLRRRRPPRGHAARGAAVHPRRALLGRSSGPVVRGPRAAAARVAVAHLHAPHGCPRPGAAHRPRGDPPGRAERRRRAATDGRRGGVRRAHGVGGPAHPAQRRDNDGGADRAAPRRGGRGGAADPVLRLRRRPPRPAYRRPAGHGALHAHRARGTGGPRGRRHTVADGPRMTARQMSPDPAEAARADRVGDVGGGE
ncbi:hypothetical protein SFR_6823 [Streptomyces sp. FR-008]|nr:hypothetical protein SFR_6823 [Streptomyces sp. FR-008]